MASEPKFSRTAFSGNAFALAPVVPGSVVPTPVVGVDVPDHAAVAVSRLPAQFQKPRIQAMLRAFAGPAQLLENVLWQLLTQRALATAVGAQLDALGVILNLPRLGHGDGNYRRRLQAVVTTKRSRGNAENLIKIARLILDDDLAQVVVTTMPIGVVTVQVSNRAVDESVADTLAQYVALGTTSGVRSIVKTSLYPPSSLFTFDTPGQGFDSGMRMSDARSIFVAP
jgi:hypothetical protein